ncbi:MAG: VanW family protein, partial [Demequinaceae bacterium]|nr:VanW family protein [Demequinaceae bacterium]
VEATLDSLVGFSWSPSALWHHAVGAGPIEPVVIVDEALFNRAVDEVTAILRQEPRDAEVVLGPTGALVRAGQDGVDIDADDIAKTLLESWPSDSPIAVPVVVTPATRDTEEAKRFARAVNGIVLGSPVTLSSPNGSVTLTPEDVVGFGSIVPDGPRFGLAMDEDALGALILERFPRVENAAVNARLAFDSKHQLYISSGVPARTLDVEALGDAVTLTVMSASRAGEIPLLESDPAVTTEDLENSDFQELISTFYTEFVPREPSREHNITNAAGKLVGLIVLPGEEFSITDAIGPITRANGYVSAGVIVGGVHTSGIGGGLCQIATTSYVTAYLAGLEIVERRPHTEWFSRYPAGRDAAIAEGIDMRFKNDTPYALMFNAYIEDAGLRVDIWSTPYYTVEASSSGKYNIAGGGYRTVTTTPCYSSYPKSGFTITDTRNIYLDGELIKTEKRVSTYRAVSGTKCE